MHYRIAYDFCVLLIDLNNYNASTKHLNIINLLHVCDHNLYLLSNIYYNNISNYINCTGQYLQYKVL
jgi:hypothetical protein